MNLSEIIVPVSADTVEMKLMEGISPFDHI